MSDQNAKGKSKYESPILVPLGEMAKGSGVCSTGSSVAGGVPWGDVTNCTVGACFASITPGITDCTGGGTASQDCTAGPNAGRDCTAGVCALRACTAGTAATTGGCAAGTANIG
jgi:hypothetical protein